MTPSQSQAQLEPPVTHLSDIDVRRMIRDCAALWIFSAFLAAAGFAIWLLPLSSNPSTASTLRLIGIILVIVGLPVLAYIPGIVAEHLYIHRRRL